ncbi:hypothetical protein SPI_04285 [Niveomyces insectorum RCEF 264]|uniref:Uncharacterized protein n=1 Tax=Niveomyces insectorum RCEF 264 TaxID=1081102 RepID=A0A167VL53_9HYPO|nr:hypothetical protein SPI_04285 [Niveomyces insectorum RCEF 264]
MGSNLSRSSKARRQRKAKAPPSMQSENVARYAACNTLHTAGIPVCIWLEDALGHLGVPTLAFELYLLVHDVAAATQILLESGYQRGKPSLAIESIPQFHNLFTLPRHEISGSPTSSEPDDSEQPSVILLPAAEWFYKLPERIENMADWFPTLPGIYSALVAKWLSLNEDEHALRLRIAVFIGYIYEYLDDTIRSPGFEQQLPAKYGQFHRDQLRGINTADLGTFKCQQHYLKNIEEGTQ